MGASYHRGESKQDYQTPPEFINSVKELLNIQEFYFDLAADAFNAQAERFYTVENSSLTKDWAALAPKGQWMWLNPPYDKIGDWAYKCFKESCRGAYIALLVPASVGSNWYRDFVHRRASVFFLNKRIQFVGATDPYPKDLMLVLYRGDGNCGNPQVWNWVTGELY